MYYTAAEIIPLINPLLPHDGRTWYKYSLTCTYYWMVVTGEWMVHWTRNIFMVRVCIPHKFIN